MTRVRGNAKTLVPAFALEHMAHVATALGTGDLRALHAEAVVYRVLERPGGHFLVEGRLAAAGVELGVTAVQRGITVGTVIHSKCLVSEICTGTGSFSTLIPEDMQLIWRECWVPGGHGGFEGVERSNEGE